MSYVDENLVSGEVVQARAHVSPMYLVPGVILTVGLFFIFAPLAIFGLLLLLSELIVLLTTEFAVTNKRVVGKAGLIRRETLELVLGKVETMAVNQGILGRILGYGTARVSGSGGTRWQAPGIASPVQFKQMVSEQVEIYMQPHAAPTPPPIAQSAVVQPPPRPAAAYCASCGTKFTVGDRFCGECGTPIG